MLDRPDSRSDFFILYDYVVTQDGVEVHAHRLEADKCDGCRGQGKPCIGPWCERCHRCDWECECWGNDSGGD